MSVLFVAAAVLTAIGFACLVARDVVLTRRDRLRAAMDQALDRP